MKKTKPLHYKALRQTLRPSALGFRSTNEIKPRSQFVGQKRAIEALTFGMRIHSHGYNLFAMGPIGTGKRSLIETILTEYAKKKKTPPDWCYIHNFDDPEKPIAISLPAGKGQQFYRDMNAFIDAISSAIINVFESEEYRIALNKISSATENKRKRICSDSSSNDVYKISHHYKQQHEKSTALQEKFTINAIKPIINGLKQKYKPYPIIQHYLTDIQENIVKHVNDFIKKDEKTDLITFSRENTMLTKYKVNLIVDNKKLKGAPVIFEEFPTYSSLICRIEYTAQYGFMTTNFTLIRPGSIHLANGGYLIIEARKIRKDKEAWEALKRALYARKIMIKAAEHEASTVTPVALEPSPIPLDVKVILLGERETYYDLCDRDPDFSELFKVPVDFDEMIDRDNKNIRLYSSVIANIIKRNDLLPFQAASVAAVIDHSSRIADDCKKLSTQMRDIEDIVLEAHFWAEHSHRKHVTKRDVEKAIQTKIYRMNRMQNLYYEDIMRGFILINTKSKIIGQVNCLSVRRIGNFMFGHPTRVTAKVRPGRGKVIDIQREIDMAGPIHSKASIVIANFLASQFTHHPFFIHASISFEQVYGYTEGDSASVAELCSLLSALAETPISQQLAVTGSIDQHGVVQAVGGLNEKIEGFFDVCKAKGLDGKQGVLIPAVNTVNLMLKEEVIAAAKANKFFIYPINHIDEAVALLTGIHPGTIDKHGNYSKHSVYAKVADKLRHFYEEMKSKRLTDLD